MINKKIAGIALGAVALVGGFSVGGGSSVGVTDTQLTPLIVSAQDSYFTLHGYYFQVLPTHSFIPTAGTQSIADLLAVPTQRGDVQIDSPYSLLKMNRDYKTDFRVTVDTCERGTERGYTILYERLNAQGQRQTFRDGHGVCGESNSWRIEQRAI